MMLAVNLLMRKNRDMTEMATLKSVNLGIVNNKVFK